jgi:hypothetical protein
MPRTSHRTLGFLIAGAFPLILLGAPPGSAFQADEKGLYPSSVVGTDFDFILETDADLFLELEYKGEGKPEMPDKTGRSASLRKPAFLYLSHYRDGTKIALAIDAEFKTEAEARKEALRYTPRLGKLPSALRQGVERVVVHKGGADATAFSDAGLIVLYSDNATKRIGTHDLEETIFHESVHAAWDKAHAGSAGWLAAQKADGRFVTEYARKNPRGEDLAESALFAYAILHYPDRIPKEEGERIRRAIPARIAFVGTLLPPGKPLHFPVCAIDLARVGPLADVLSGALIRGLAKPEREVREFLAGARDKYSDADTLIRAAAARFEVEEKALRGQIEKYRHSNCAHGDRLAPPDRGGK